MKKNVISEEIALDELKKFIHKWVKRPCKDEELADEYPDILEAIMLGNLKIDPTTLEPVYTLVNPIKNDKGEVSMSQVTFKTRIKPNTKADLANGIDLKKQVAKYSLIVTAYIVGVTTRELDLFDREDYDVISQVAVVFM